MREPGITDRTGAPAALKAPKEVTFTLSARWLRSFIFYVIPTLAVLSVLMTIVKMRSESTVIVEIADRFIFNVEASLPTVLSFVLMVTASQLCVLIFFSWRAIQRKSLNTYWLVLSVIMIALAYDETAQFHEKLPSPIFGDVLGSHGWIVIGITVLLVLAVLFVPFLLAIPRHLAKRLLLAAAIFLLGAIVIEGIGGLYAFRMGRNFVYRIITVLEESVELVGMSYLNFVLLEHVARQRLVLRFSDGGEKSVDAAQISDQDGEV